MIDYEGLLMFSYRNEWKQMAALNCKRVSENLKTVSRWFTKMQIWTVCQCISIMAGFHLTIYILYHRRFCLNLRMTCLLQVKNYHAKHAHNMTQAREDILFQNVSSLCCFFSSSHNRQMCCFDIIPQICQLWSLPSAPPSLCPPPTPQHTHTDPAATSSPVPTPAKQSSLC